MNETPAISVAICTRNRGASIAATILSLRRSTHTDFEVVVIDQSEDEVTARAVAGAATGDPRIRYVHTPTRGLSVARNIALRHVRAPLVAWTDDDCEVAEDWLERIIETFARHPEAGQVCGAVLPGPHDAARGFIPDHPVPALRVVRSPWKKFRAGGIGANLAFRREALERAGPWDEVLSAGGPLHSCEDGDMTFRVLRAGFAVVETPEVRVVHHGFRTWDEGSQLMRRTGVAIGAYTMKHVRMGDLAMLPTLLYEWGVSLHWRRLVRLQRRSGVARFAAFHAGLVQAFRYPVDRQRRVFLPRGSGGEPAGIPLGAEQQP